jgi:hypothetical protein
VEFLLDKPVAPLRSTPATPRLVLRGPGWVARSLLRRFRKCSGEDHLDWIGTVEELLILMCNVPGQETGHFSVSRPSPLSTRSSPFKTASFAACSVPQPRQPLLLAEVPQSRVLPAPHVFFGLFRDAHANILNRVISP